MLAVEQPNNVESVYGQTYRAVRKVSDAISITLLVFCHCEEQVTPAMLSYSFAFIFNER